MPEAIVLDDTTDVRAVAETTNEVITLIHDFVTPDCGGQGYGLRRSATGWPGVMM